MRLPAATPLTDVKLSGSANEVKTGATLTISGTLALGSATLTGSVPITNGGTGSTSASAARTALGVAIGSNVQAYDADLTTFAAITPSANVQSLLGAADYAAMRTQLSLVVGTHVQAYDADLTTFAGISPSANVQSLLGAADYAAARALLDLEPSTDVQAYDAELAALAGLTSAADKVAYFTGSGTAALADFSSYGRSLAAAADAAAARTLLEVTSGSGDVVGPASAVDDRLATFDGTTGKLIQDGGKTIAELNPAGAQTIYVPAAAMLPSTTSGCAALAIVEISAGQPDLATLDFDAGTEEYAQFAIAMPKSWDNGTITAQFLWSHASTTTNFAVVWGAQAVAVSDDDALGASFGTAQTVTDTGGTTSDLYISAATAAVTVGGTPATGDQVYFRIYRKAADAADTLAIDARLHGVRLVYTTAAANDN